MPIDSEKLIEMAERAIQQPAATELQSRRAVSTAHYALFHSVLRNVTEHFVGASMNGAYVTLYRSIKHHHVLDVGRVVDVNRIASPRSDRLGFREPSGDLRVFAGGFKDLQQARHDADYDPSKRQDAEDARTSVETARNAIDAFARVPDAQRNPILLYIAIGRK